MSVRVIFFIIGVLLTILSVTMSIPFVVECFSSSLQNAYNFLIAMFCTGFFGVALTLGNRPDGRFQLGTREAFITTTLLWVVVCLFASLPFYCASKSITFVDACFESVSALTTTGATVLHKLDTQPKGILLWRSILQWLGGIGIVVMAMTIFPILRIGGMQLFRSEFSDRSEKILPRVSQIATGILIVYIGFTLLCAFLLYIAGMSLFDAACHSMTAISTGGLSTKDASIGAFNSPVIEAILCIFMFIGGSTLVLYVRLFNKDWQVLKDSQLRAYFLYTCCVILLMTLWYYASHDASITAAFRQSAFLSISIISSTGYILNDYTTWGAFAMLLVFILSFSGGCTGSTTGGIKIFRFQIIYNIAKSHLHHLKKPYGVYVPMYQNWRITDAVSFSIVTFIVLYFISIVIISGILILLGFDVLSGLSGAVSCLGNVGPGVSHYVGYTAHMGDLSSCVKCVMMFSMLLGRLELLTILILLMPSFWKN